MAYLPISYQSAINYLKEDDMNTISIRNFSEENYNYMIDGGEDSLLDLELEENEDFEMYEFYKCISLEEWKETCYLDYIKTINKIYQQSVDNHKEVIKELKKK